MPVDTSVSPPPRRLVTAAIKTTLATVTTRPFGVADVPTPEPGRINPETPYGLIYPINDGSYWGSLGAPESNARFAFQVTSVGATAEQCEWLSDRVRTAILGRETSGTYNTQITLTAPYACVFRESLSGAGNMIRSDQMWSVSETYMLHITTQ